MGKKYLPPSLTKKVKDLTEEHIRNRWKQPLTDISLEDITKTFLRLWDTVPQ